MQLRHELSPETKALLPRLRQAGESFGHRLLRAAGSAAEEMVEEVQMSISSTFKQRSGTLLRSVAGGARYDGDAITIHVGVTRGPATAYAVQQEVGGVISAKPGHALPVPIGAGLNRTAVIKSPSQLPSSIQRKLILIERMGKPPLLCLRLGRPSLHGFSKGAALQPMYVLKKSVRLQATWWLHNPMTRIAPNLIPAAIDSALQESILGSLGGPGGVA